MTDQNLTHIVLILDRSGSMSMLGKNVEAEKGVRTFVDEQKVLPGRLELTIARFDDRYDLLAESVDANDFNHDHLKIEPRGSTALRDAIGSTVVKVGQNLAARPEHERPGRVVVVIATDGLENASSKFSPDKIKQIITEQTDKYGWDFIFMGTSQDAVLQAQSYGISAMTSYSTTDSAMGVASAYAAASNTITRARTKGVRAEVTDEDRKNLK